MFSQFSKSSWSRRSDSLESNPSLFFSVSNTAPEADVNEAIPLQESREHEYNTDYNDEENLFETNSPTPSEEPISRYTTTQTPAAIYLDVPPIPSVHDLRTSLSEGLLPSTSIPPSLLAGLSKRKYNDSPFAILFLVGIFVLFLAGVNLPTKSPLEDYQKTIYFAISRSTVPLIFAIVSSTIFGTIWIFFLRSFAKVLVWGTVLVVPLVTAFMFVWTLLESFSGDLTSGKPDPQDSWLAILSSIPLVICLIYLKLIYSRRKRIDKTVKVIQLACSILKNNPYMFSVSFLILACYILFTIIWLVFFNRLFLLGQVTGVMDNNAYFQLFFFVFMYWWTSAVFSNIQRATLAGVVSNWYFYRQELDPLNNQNITKMAIKRATTTSFGTVCLGALMLSSVQTLQAVSSFFKRRFRGSSYSILLCISACLGCLDGLIDNLNNYTLIYVGISGESFCSSALVTTKIFRRNLIFGLVTDFITKLVLSIGSIIIALLCGFATFIFATHSLHSPYGYVAGITAAIIPYYVMQIFSCIVANTVDATFMCYAIDIDNNLNHCNLAHEAFAGL